MSKENEKSGKKMPVKNLKEKRAEKAFKRLGKYKEIDINSEKHN